MDWRYLVMGLCAIGLGLVRLRRGHRWPRNTTQKAIITGLMATGVAAVSYSSMATLNPLGPLKNSDLALWHSLLGILIGSLEVLTLTLRTEQVHRWQVRRIMIRSGLVAATLAATWPFGFSSVVLDDLSAAPRNPALIMHLVVFHAYLLWGLCGVVVLAVLRFPTGPRRRPLNALALAGMGAGCAGFASVNAQVGWRLLTEREPEVGAVMSPTPFYLALVIASFVVLGFGNRVHEALVAMRDLRTLAPLSRRLTELSDLDLRLDVALPLAARRQRAYAEISDALCTLRIAATTPGTIAVIAHCIWQGNVSTSRGAPTISDVLPRRATRSEDLALIHALAQAYCRLAAAPGPPHETSSSRMSSSDGWDNLEPTR